MVSISSRMFLSLYMSTLDPSVVNSGQYLPQAVSLPLHVHSRPLCGQQWSVAPPVYRRMFTPSSCPLQPRLWSTVVSSSSRLFLSLYMSTPAPSVVNSGQYLLQAVPVALDVHSIPLCGQQSQPQEYSWLLCSVTRIPLTIYYAQS